MMGYGWAAGFGGWFWMIGSALVFIGIVVLIVWAVDSLARRGRSGPAEPGRPEPGRPTPDEILRERFARGEITAAEFEEARRILGSDR